MAKMRDILQKERELNKYIDRERDYVFLNVRERQRQRHREGSKKRD